MKPNNEHTVNPQAAAADGQVQGKESPVQGNEGATDQQNGKKKEPSSGRFLLRIIDGTFLAKENMVRSLPFLFFMTFLGLIYIANTYYAEKMVRINDRTIRDLKELRYEHITVKSQLMTLSKQSEVAKRLAGTGIKESVVPPEKIFIPLKADQDQPKPWLPNTEAK